ncbi:MAG: insulinase family protein [Planctomycetes bacterium]|nr:insulinase family protein [Planctomycetota bacterium]NUQ34339.1 insulinase family protein [Planctomycetaceae bacterium]
MRRTPIIAIMTVLALTQVLGAEGLGIRQAELDNGLKLVVLPIDGVPRVECRLVYNVGSADDRPGMTGMAHFLEHMMMNGSQTFGSKDWDKENRELEKLDIIADELMATEERIEDNARAGKAPNEDLLDRRDQLKDEFEEQEKICSGLVDDVNVFANAGASSINAFTSADLTAYQATMPTNTLELFFWVHADLMRNCAFRDFYTEREAVLEERRRAIERDKRRLYEQTNALVWEAVPYRNPNLGWPDDVRAIKRRQMIEHYHKYYVPNNAALILTGDITMERATDLASRYFGAIPRAPAPPRLYTRNAIPAGEKFLYAEERDRPSVQVLYETVPGHHADTLALDMLSDWLGSASGPLYKKLVINEQLAVSVNAGHGSMKLGGMFRIRAAVREAGRHEQLNRRINEIVEAVLKGDKEAAPKQEDIEAFAARLERMLTEQLTDMKSAAETLVYSVFSSGVEMFERVVTEARALTPDTVLKRAAVYLVPQRRTTVHVTPPGSGAVPDPKAGTIAELVRRLSEEQDPDRRRELERLVAKLRDEK